MTGDTSESDSTSADGFSAEGTRHRPISETIKGLFRKAAGVLFGRAEDEPQPEERRRKGETDGDWRKLTMRPALAGQPAARGRYGALRAVARERADTADAFGRAAQDVLQPAPEDAYDGALAYLSDTLDCLNPYWPPDAQHVEEIDNGLSPQQNYDFPQP